MTQANEKLDDHARFDRRRPSRSLLSLRVFGTIALTLGALAGALILDAHTAADPTNDHRPVIAAKAIVALNVYGALLDPAFSLGFVPAPLATNPSRGPNFASESPAAPASTVEPPAAPVTPPADKIQSVQSAPLPTPRPPEFNSAPNAGSAHPPTRRVAQQNRPAALQRPLADNRSLFEKLFGLRESSGPILGYAAAEDTHLDDVKGKSFSSALGYDRWTAIYDIAAHTVYMPNGARLEAHSGLGDRLDDTRHVNERNRGATPPNVYDLAPREQLFHGVQALRLTPVRSGDTFGRTGLLAHTYMLGPNGDSNGCVSFKDYHAFLQAFSTGEVRRLAVVARLI